MTTLLIRIIAPMQSWGIQSNFTVRDSGLEPSKSGIIGLICAALGRSRSAKLDDLTKLRMGVRVDREGILKRDFHIAQNVLLGKGKGTKNSIITNRYYLADAAFLVGLEGDENVLTKVQAALKNPIWQLYFGRKSFVPAFPIWMENGLQLKENLENSLKEYPLIVEYQDGLIPDWTRLVIENPDGEQIRNDVPISFAQRKFVSRRVSISIIAGQKNSQEALK